MSDGGVGGGVHAAALASLPQAGSRRLSRLLAGRSPAAAWELVLQEAVPAAVADATLRAAWAAHAAELDLTRLAARLRQLGITVTTPGDPLHPWALAADIDPAPVIFRQGRPCDRSRPTVTIVGTRRCSPTGRSVSFEFGAGLAAAGVTVVSGLALGVDGAAHRGALSVEGAPVVGVVASGLDVVYPRANGHLWSAVRDAGTLLSEAPLGGEPERWRFPARNRFLAALADVVVVVESARAGGSMLTVEQAVRRGVTVMAVPGSVRNEASAGANQLICEGCPPACSVEDVLTAVGLATEGADQPAHPALPDEPRAVPDEPSDELHRMLLGAVDDQPVSIDRLVLRVGAPAPAVLVALAYLENEGLLAREGGRVMRA